MLDSQTYKILIFKIANKIQKRNSEVKIIYAWEEKDDREKFTSNFKIDDSNKIGSSAYLQKISRLFWIR